MNEQSISVYLAIDVRPLFWEYFDSQPIGATISSAINRLLRVGLPELLAMDKRDRQDLKALIRRELKGLRKDEGGTTEGESLHNAVKKGKSVGQFVGHSEPSEDPKTKTPEPSVQTRRHRGGSK